jgi:hypothetical protein
MRGKLELLMALAAVALWANMAAHGREPEKRQNTIKIRMTEKGTVEFEVTSDRAFPVVSAAPVITVGKASSLMSRYPSGDNLKTLVFIMSADEFAKAADGDAIVVRYNPDSQGVWEFGKLDKKKIGK